MSRQGKKYTLGPVPFLPDLRSSSVCACHPR